MQEQKRLDYDKAFEILLKDGTIYQPPRDAIFDFVEAVLAGKVNKSFDLYDQCVAIGEAVMVMLTVLYNNAKAVLQVQTCGSKDISKSTGLTGWQIKNAKPLCGIYTDDELITLLQKIQSCEIGIKTGRVDEEFVMEYILTTTL